MWKGYQGVDWKQLGGRFEQFQNCQQITESIIEGEVVWCSKLFAFEIFLYSILNYLQFNFTKCQGAI